MQTPPAPSSSLLTRKVGPAPVWGWGVGVLAGAYLWSKHKAGSAAATSAPSAGAAQPAAGAPYYVIENNVPPVAGASPSQPVPPPTGQPPVSTPPSTTPNPPTNQAPPPDAAPGPAAGSASSAPAAAPAHTSTYTYRVVSGDTLGTIAAKHHLSAADLWAFQLDPRNNPPAQIATLKSRGPGNLRAGETIRIPANH